MTIQDELARPWFQPPVPSDPGQDRNRSDFGPLTTRIAGQLPLDEIPATPAQQPSPAPGPERVEVTQPYIPAIRDEQPAFAKRLNPEPVPDTPELDPTPHAPTAPPPPAAPAEKAPPTARAQPAQPVRKRSLVRRVVRGIIGPDLLRKDPPKRR